uniref:Uncharacterized protein n=1 Tax=Lepeophtheirus salmonis TaxID=72036 RepID=A0A0K2US75_LEPSM
MILTRKFDRITPMSMPNSTLSPTIIIP